MKRWVLPGFLSLITVLSGVVPGITSSAEHHWDGAIAQPLPPQQKPEERAWELLRVARRFIATQQPDQSVQTVLQAAQVAQSVTDRGLRDRILAHGAKQLAALGQMESAIALTQGMMDQSTPPQDCCISLKTEANVAIVRGYLKAGSLPQARQFIARFPASRAPLQVPLIEYLADQGQFAEALALMRQLPEGLEAGLVRLELVQAYIMANRWTEGLALVRSVKDTNERLSLLALLRQWAIRSGQYSLAEQTVEQVSGSEEPIYAWTEVALAYARAGQRSQAQAVLTRAYQLAKGQDQPARWASKFAEIGNFEQALALTRKLQGYEQKTTQVSIARVYSDIGQYARAIALTRAIRDGELQPFGDLPDPKVETIQQIGQQALQAGRFDLALQATNQLDQGQNRVPLLRAIAQQYRQRNQPKKALEVLDQAVAAAKTVDRITIFYDRMTYITVSNAELLLELARDYQGLGQRQRAIALLNESLASARILKEPNMMAVREQVTYLGAIAQLYRQLDQPDQALKAAESALTLVKTFPRNDQSVYWPSWHVQALAAVAEVFGEVGARQQVAQVLSEAEALTRTIQDPSMWTWAQMAIVEAYAATSPVAQVEAAVQTGLKRLPSLPNHEQAWLQERLTVAAATPDSDYTLQLVQQIPARNRQVSLLGQIAVNYYAKGLHAQAQTMVTQLQLVADQLPEDGERDQVLQEVIRQLLAVPRGENLAISQLLQAGQVTAVLAAPKLRAESWSQIAQTYADRGEVSGASQTMGFALEIVEQMEDRFEKRNQLWQLFDEVRQTGERSLALQVANRMDAPDRSTALQWLNPSK